MITRFLLILTLALLLAACAGQPSSMQDSQQPSPDQAGNLGSIDDLTTHLREAGSEVEQGEAVEQPFFSVPGQKLLVNGQEVQVFVYDTEAARQAESSQISKDGSSIGTTMINWIEPPHFWAKGKLISLYIGSNQEVINRMNQVMDISITQP